MIALIGPADELVPVAVQFDAPQVQQRFGALGNPSHAGAIHPFPHHVPHRSLHLPTGDDQVLLDPLVVLHHPQTRLKVADQFPHRLALPLRPWTTRRNLLPHRPQPFHQRAGTPLVHQFLPFLDLRLQLLAPFRVEATPHLPQLLHHVAHVHREDRVGEFLLQVLPQPLGPIHHDLNRLGRLRTEAPPSRLRTRPLRRRLAPPKRRPSPFVKRSVQLPIVASMECIHHHDHHFLAVLTLVPLLATPLRAPRTPLRLPAMTLATARATARVSTFPTPLLQLRLGRRRRALAVHLNHQHRTIVPRRRLLLQEGRRLPPQAQHQVLDGFGRGRPSQRRPADQPARPVTHPRGQPRHELHHPGRESVACQAQHRVQRMEPATASLPNQMSPSVGDLTKGRLQFPLRVGRAQAIAFQRQIRLQVQAPMPRHQQEPHQDAAQGEDARQQTLLAFPKRPVVFLAKGEQRLEGLSRFLGHGFHRGWTRLGRGGRLIAHGAYSEPRLCGAQRCGEDMLQLPFRPELANIAPPPTFTSSGCRNEAAQSPSLTASYDNRPFVAKPIAPFSNQRSATEL